MNYKENENIYNKIFSEIEGWYCKGFTNILKRINKIHKNNNINGNIMEIGVFHGKSFIPLAMQLTNNEKILAVDIFEDLVHDAKNCAHLNIEIRPNFEKNINKIFSKDFINNKIIIHKANTINLTYKYFKNLIKNNMKYRIISIDGDHSLEGTYNDILIATNLISDDGIIIIDDYFNTGQPYVRKGVDKFMKENNTFIPFYIRYNKLVLCNIKYYDLYVNVFCHDINYAIKFTYKQKRKNIWKK